MVCFDGGTFGLETFLVCTEREVKCDGECAATLTLSALTILMALYDAFNISRHLKYLVASRRHLVSMMVSLGLYAFMNGMNALITEERLMWAGISSFLRIYFVYSYMLWTMSILFVEGWGDFEELVERTGRLLEESHGKNEAWVRSCVFKVQVWMAETVRAGGTVSRAIAAVWAEYTWRWPYRVTLRCPPCFMPQVVSFIVKHVCNTYLVFTKLDGRRINFWKGGFFYIMLIDMGFTIVCAGGMSQVGSG